MFRYERPQKGRQREFHQIGVELLGAVEPLADAETLEMLDRFLGELGIEDRELRLGSVGDEQCRPAAREALREWLRPRLDRLCADCRRRFSENPLRVLDCKVEEDRRLLEEAPRLQALLCADCRAHFEELCRLLDEYGVRWRPDDRLVRGLDYYRRTVFEVVSSRLGAQNAILGGGRYDGLVQELGGPAVPGFGFAIGIERLVSLTDPRRAPAQRPDVALVGLGAEGFRATLALARRLRAGGLSVLAAIAPRPLGQQLRRADRAGARFVVFVGPDELARGRYGVKELASGEQVERDEAGILELARSGDVR
jgi:histidyl-tRNA synthetase